MDENINPEKFIYAYPEIGNNFSYKMYRRKELYDNRLHPTENIEREKGVPLLSQKLSSIFFSEYTQYKSGLFYHEPGTGKSCLSSFIIENFKNTLVGGKPRKPALIIVPNATLEKNYREGIAMQCTKKGTYMSKLTTAEMEKVLATEESLEITELTKERRLKAAIDKTYEIVTHDAFLTNLPKDKNTIRDLYSNRIIVIDEAHHFRLQTASGENKKKKPTAKDLALGKEPGLSEQLYTILYDFLHTVEDCRILLLTGTPIWDQVDEIATLLNLILSIENKLPVRKEFMREFFDDDNLLIKEKEVELKNLIREMVSFLRSMMTTAKIEEIGVNLPWLKRIKVYPSVMSDFQYKLYKEASENITITTFNYKSKSGEMKKIEREIMGGPMRLLARDASTFIFPVLDDSGKLTGGTYGQGGFSKNIRKIKGMGYAYKNENVETYIKNNLNKVSSKFYDIVELLKKNPNENAFIYDEYVSAGGGGAINLALVLQTQGFVWAKSANQIQKPDSKGRKRFCIITSDSETLSNPKEIQKFINSFNEPDNKYGERCQIIIGSRKIAEGITIKNIRQGHIVMGHWNIPSIDQALGRIFRVGSHDAFEEHEKIIKIYKHAAVKKGENGEKYSKEETIDIKVYKIGENKEYYNTQIYRLLKEVSWDCPLTYERNVLAGDEDNTRSTDYNIKNYKCYGFPSRYIDRSGDVWKYNLPEEKIIRDTYDLFYNSSDVVKLMNKIKKLFEEYSNIHLDEFYSKLNIEKKEEFLLLKTLDYMVSARVKIKNRYGFTCALNEKGNIYFLDDSTNTFSEYSSWYYSEYPLISEYKNLEELSTVNQYLSDKKNIEDFCKDPSLKSVKNMNYLTSIILLETIHSLKNSGKKLKPKEKKAIDIVMDILGRNLYFLENGDTVHVMYTTEYMGLGYNVALQEIKPNNKMKIYNKTTKEWGNIDDHDLEEKYIKYIKSSQKSTEGEDWEKFPKGIYGYKDKNGKFKIKVKPDVGQKTTRGSVCLEASWGLPRLYTVMNNINALPKPDAAFNKLKRKEVISAITSQPKLGPFWNSLEKRTDEELKSILTLNKLDKRMLCDFLEEWFKKEKMYVELG